MHALDVIKLRNARAEGREQGHVHLDQEQGGPLTHVEEEGLQALVDLWRATFPELAAYLEGYLQGRTDTPKREDGPHA